MLHKYIISAIFIYIKSLFFYDSNFRRYCSSVSGVPGGPYTPGSSYPSVGGTSATPPLTTQGAATRGGRKQPPLRGGQQKVLMNGYISYHDYEISRIAVAKNNLLYRNVSRIKNFLTFQHEFLGL